MIQFCWFRCSGFLPHSKYTSIDLSASGFVMYSKKIFSMAIPRLTSPRNSGFVDVMFLSVHCSHPHITTCIINTFSPRFSIVYVMFLSVQRSHLHITTCNINTLSQRFSMASKTSLSYHIFNKLDISVLPTIELYSSLRAPLYNGHCPAKRPVF